MKALGAGAGWGLLLLAVAARGAAAGVATEVDGLRVEVTSEPARPLTDRMTTYTVRLADAAGRPVTAARVTLTGRMADGMSAAGALRPSGEPGAYRGQVLFTMEGAWDLTLRVVRGGRRAEIPFREEVRGR